MLFFESKIIPYKCTKLQPECYFSHTSPANCMGMCVVVALRCSSPSGGISAHDAVHNHCCSSVGCFVSGAFSAEAGAGVSGQPSGHGLTALDLINHAAADEKPTQFVHMEPYELSVGFPNARLGMVLLGV